VLDRPEIPLHTNGSENDIRCHVTRRKVSAGTRSDIGRDLPRCLSRSRQNLRQARNRVLGPPWRPTRHPGHSRRPTPARNHPRQSPTALTATGFAPLTGIDLLKIVRSNRWGNARPARPLRRDLACAFSGSRVAVPSRLKTRVRVSLATRLQRCFTFPGGATVQPTPWRIQCSGADHITELEECLFSLPIARGAARVG
jgi:hypothetical protein